MNETDESKSTMKIPECPKIYHILHLDRLHSVVSAGYLWSHAQAISRKAAGTDIGMTDIKNRRLNELTLKSYPGLFVGQCVPFYFCPRSIMLYIFHKRNISGLNYRGGQESIIHLEADLYASIDWAKQNNLRWAFTTSNAGAYTFEDYNDLQELPLINWKAVQATDWRQEEIKRQKQAEFLVENRFSWHLIDRIGVYSTAWRSDVKKVISGIPKCAHRPSVEVRYDWYY